MIRTPPRAERLPSQRPHDGRSSAAGERTRGHGVPRAEAGGVPRELRACLAQELENLRRLLAYRGLERRFAGDLRSVEATAASALAAGSRTLSLAALRAIGALTRDVNRAPGAEPRAGSAAAVRA